MELRIPLLTITNNQGQLTGHLTPREQELATMPYTDYLKTDEWQEKRRAALLNAGYRCELCHERKPLDVHHLTYDRRGYERPSDLQALCRDCHEAEHFRARSEMGTCETCKEYQVIHFDTFFVFRVRWSMKICHKNGCAVFKIIGDLTNAVYPKIEQTDDQIAAPSFDLARAAKAYRKSQETKT